MCLQKSCNKSIALDMDEINSKWHIIWTVSVLLEIVNSKDVFDFEWVSLQKHNVNLYFSTYDSNKIHSPFINEIWISMELLNA